MFWSLFRAYWHDFGDRDSRRSLYQEKRKRKIFRKIFALRFFYHCGVSTNKNLGYWDFLFTGSPYPENLAPRSPYYEKRKGKILRKNFALRFCIILKYLVLTNSGFWMVHFFHHFGVCVNKISVLNSFCPKAVPFMENALENFCKKIQFSARKFFLLPRSPYHEKRKGKLLRKNFAFRFLLMWILN